MAKTQPASEEQQSRPRQPLAKTPLYDISVELKAKMTDFAGWEMPIQYVGINQEHQAVRNGAGMFDVSHMGKFVIKGQQLRTQLQALVPSDLERLKPGEAQYTVLLNRQAGILDDFIFYYQGLVNPDEEQGLLIVNAATKVRDKAWILTYLEKTTLNFQDLSKDKVLLAVQGPQAVNYLQPFVAANLTPIKAFGHLETLVLGKQGFIARTGYTGEDGFEVMVDPEVGIELWRSLLNAGVTPCGLGARDTLRLEAGMMLYGQDLLDTTTPLESGLNWLVHLKSKGDFIGRTALERQQQEGLTLKLVAMRMEGRHIARHGYPVLTGGIVVGEVTSGSWSPTLECGIAFAYVPAYLDRPGEQLEIEIRGKAYPAVVVKKPFYRSPHRVK